MQEGIFSRVRQFVNTGTGRWVGIAAILALLAGAAAVFLRDTTRSRADAVRAKGKAVLYYCKSCKATGEVRVTWDEKFPIKCPRCGQQTAVVAFRCVKCHEIIEQKADLVYPCPKCGFVYDKRIVPKDPLGAPRRE